MIAFYTLLLVGFTTLSSFSMVAAVSTMALLGLSFLYMAPRTGSLWAMLLPSAALSTLSSGLWAIASFNANGKDLLEGQPLLRDVVTGITAGATYFLTACTVVFGAAYGILRWTRASRMRRYPEIAAFWTTKDLSEWVTASELSFDDFQDRRDNVRRLEQLALIFETGFGTALPCPSGSQQPFALVAAHFRSLRSWIALPQAETRRNLQYQFATTLNALASGQYHYLPRAEYALPENRTSTFRRAVNLGRTVLVGALPFLALLALDATHVDVDSKVHTTWLIGSLAWACVTYITAMDPLSAAKFTNTRDLLSVLTPRKQD